MAKIINKKIIFGDNEIIVESTAAIRANQTGKTMLEIIAKEENASEENLKQLKYNTEPVEYLEQEVLTDDDTGMTLEIGEWEKKNTYLDYDSGDYASGYKDGKYTCWVTRMDETERKLRKALADIERISRAVNIDLD